ncbi:MAG: GTP-binding protein [Promethearchaeota archaeon]|nr:MAG: GTP-binding protein [Candidatus Lokiarchaeota archaeon]
MSYRGKVILLGDAGVGKTSLIARYVDNMFRSEYIQTVGANFLIKEVNLKRIVEKMKRENLEIPSGMSSFTLFYWDIGGQKDKLFVTEYYFLQAVGAMVAFSIANRESFNNLDFWISKMKELSGDVPFIIIGNKTDLQDKRVVHTEEIEKKAKAYGVQYFETSAKLNESVDIAFEDLSIQILNNLK